MKDIENTFAEIEKRVRSLVAQNKNLKGRIKELDDELAKVRREAQGMEHFHGKTMHVREKIERILQSLETVKNKE